MKKQNIISSLLLSLLFAAFFANAGYAQTQKQKDCHKDQSCQMVKFKTSASTDANQADLEKALKAVNGVEKAEFCQKEKVFCVNFKSDVVTSDALMKVITDKGFTAEIVKDDASKSACCDKDKKDKKSCCKDDKKCKDKDKKSKDTK
jgi:hypothetical protein